MQNEIKIQDIADRLKFSIENTHKILDIFYESTSTIINNLETSIHNKDFDKICHYAHSLKGSSSNLLFNEVYDIAKQVEEKAKNKMQYPYLEKATLMRRLIKETKII